VSTTGVDLRCPVTPQRLFARLMEASIVEGNLIEVACGDCRKTARRMGQNVVLVLHRYNLLGECVETEIRQA